MRQAGYVLAVTTQPGSAQRARRRSRSTATRCSTRPASAGSRRCSRLGFAAKPRRGAAWLERSSTSSCPPRTPTGRRASGTASSAGASRTRACPEWTTGWRRPARASGAAIFACEDRTGYPNYYFATDDIDASSRRCASSAATRRRSCRSRAHGWFAACNDSEGNAFHLWQQDSSAASGRDRARRRPRPRAAASPSSKRAASGALAQLAADVAPVDRLAEDGGLPERERLEPVERARRSPRSAPRSARRARPVRGSPASAVAGDVPSGFGSPPGSL